MEWTRQGLDAAGFSGFVRFEDLRNEAVPRTPGVHVVVRERDDDPTFTDTSRGGRFKGNDPSVDQSALRAAWLETPESDPEDVESRLLDEFGREHGARPSANRGDGRRRPSG